MRSLFLVSEEIFWKRNVKKRVKRMSYRSFQQATIIIKKSIQAMNSGQMNKAYKYLQRAVDLSQMIR